VHVQPQAPEGHRARHDLVPATLSAAVAVAILLGAIVTQAAGSAPSDAAALAAARSEGPARGAPLLRGTAIVRWGSQYPEATGYERFRYVLVSRQFASRAARLPGASLVYMSGTTIHRSWSTGVSYYEALNNDWLLKSADGRYVLNERYAGFIADVGSATYQQRFVNDVTEFMRASGVDGVFLDDVVAAPLGMTGGVYPAKYPTAEAWEAAIVDFVTRVGRVLKERGFYVLANASKYVSGDARSDTSEHVAAFWRRIAPDVNGLMSENWLQNPNDAKQLRARGPRWHDNWDGWQSLVAVAQRAGADFFGLTYGSAGDRRAMRYARGSFLLDWAGRGGALVYAVTDRPDPYDPAWVRQLGRPLRAKVERAPGVWERRYERGTVVVNSTASPVAVKVGRLPWTIAGTDAAFLRRGPT
jgi:hypothetical protein